MKVKLTTWGIVSRREGVKLKLVGRKRKVTSWGIVSRREDVEGK